MKYKAIHEIAFSPNFSTDKCTLALAEALAVELGAELKTDSFTTPKDRKAVRSYNNDDILVIGSPVYAGKLPNKILPDFQSKFKGNNTPAIAVLTFGNRSYDNGLAEMTDTLKANGFTLIAALAIVNEHVMAHTAVSRPDNEDFKYITECAGRIAAKINADRIENVTVPGDSSAPYYTPLQENRERAVFLKAKPKTDLEKCIKCGACAKNCPMGSIDFTDVTNVPGICIKCHACVNKCPQNAKYFDDEQLLSHIRFLQKNHNERKENECFI